VIIDSVPKELIIKLGDVNSFFGYIAPRGLIEAVMDAATPDTTLESTELIKLCNAPLIFDTDKQLSL
jgi:hypothetical protein